MQGADPPAGPAYCEMSRTESEGQERPLLLPVEEHLPSQSDWPRAILDGIHASPCKYCYLWEFWTFLHKSVRGFSGATK